MLSIGKLAADQATYYLDQAEGRVDVVESVGGGVEDYYAGGNEARGEWAGAGAGAARLGLGGRVEGEELRGILAGLSPRDGLPLRSSSSAVRVAGFDLTFSAPKSVSVVFGLGDDDMRDAVRRGQDRAVKEAIGYLERSAAAVRRGHGGARVELADGLVAAAFRHRTSRAGDPQLHTHVLVANLGRGPDGRWSALDGRRLYAHARAASFVYQAVLRAELSRALGVEWAPVRKGIAELAGVPKPVLRAFSRRRAEIDAALEERGTSGARAAEAAALATRRAKRGVPAADELTGEWRARAAALGFELAVLGRRRMRRPYTPELERVFDALVGPAGLTRRASTFTRRDVLQAMCERLPASEVADARSIEEAADRFLGSSRVVPLLPDMTDPDAGEVFRRRDGRLLPFAREELRYSTPELLALERRLVEQAVDGRGAGVCVVAPAPRSALSDEQGVMVERLCLGGDRVAVVVGKAGTGKTFALGTAREAWQAAGHPVLGVAVARRAARELQDGAGIASTSVAALLHGSTVQLPERCVLVVDEAGMVSTRQLAQLLDAVEAADGKMVLVGDHRQLPEIEAGGAFRGLASRGLAVELTENRRQVEGWERLALDHLRDGRGEQALRLYAEKGRVAVADTAERSRERLVDDWVRAGDPARVVMIAHRRDDVADLNARARERMRAAGRLGGDELVLPGGGFSVGDHVVVKRNSLHRGVSNGDRGRVAGIDAAAGTLTLDCRGGKVMLDAAFLQDPPEQGEPTLLHGYAITAHVAQGLTVDHAFVLADEGISRELAYTALSRGRHTNRLYVARGSEAAREEFAPADRHGGDVLERLGAALSRSSASSMAIDSGDDAMAALRDARARRRQLEGKGASWLPGRRRELEAARQAEAAAGDQLRDLRREQVERRHGATPFVTEEHLDECAAQQRARLFERSRNRGRGMER